MRQRLLLPTLVSVLTACGGSSEQAVPSSSPSPSNATTTRSASGAVHEVQATASRHFLPERLTLVAGDSVLVTNGDPDGQHNATVAGVGASGTMDPGDTFSLTFAKAGSYTLVCTFHDGMDAQVVVR